ncbi:hypothetical protein B5M09_002374 [Aphanomyces astaci]|uniref:Phospholipase B-like n=1 Tax=Aphanomyces astaci TaxID=112090 RepID=A0A3R7WMD7_APHAT|nr:hypothetical protein B5M09_002374 [Aphanomyces astaci]
MVTCHAIVAAIAALSVAQACTIVAVTKEASADKTPLTAHTDDAGFGAADLRLVFVPAADYDHGSERAVYDFNPGYPRVTTMQRGPDYMPKVGENLTEPLGYIPQVQHTYAYFDQDYGIMNEVQLSIAESTCAAKTNASAVWAAQRVPQGHVAAVANGFIIRELNLTNSDNYLASPNVHSFAQSMGWWDPSAGPFDFTAAYNYHTPGPIGPLYVGRRVWRILDWFAPSLRLNATLGQSTLPTYPFSVPVDAPVTLHSVFELLKDHYEGTAFDMTQGLAAGPFGNPTRLLRFNQINADVRAEAAVWQARAMDQQLQWRRQPAVNASQLQAANNLFADQVFDAWWALAWRLVSKFTDGFVTTGEGAGQMQIPGYPAAWLRQTEFNNWPGKTFRPPVAEMPTVLATSFADPLDGGNGGVWHSLALVVAGVAVGVWGQRVRERYARRRSYDRLL